jgi:hypothetical protein
MSFNTRKRNTKRTVQAATKWSLSSGVVEYFSPKSSTRSRGWQSLALNHALFVTRATFTALVEHCGAMGIAANFQKLHFLNIVRDRLTTNGDGMVEAHHSFRTFVKSSLLFLSSSTV